MAYFPNDLDRTFWEVLSPDHALLLRNTVDWASGSDRPVYVDGPGVVDVTVWRQNTSMTVHLVNLTNPMFMKGPYRELVPLPPQRVRVKLPDGAKPRRVHLLAADRTPAGISFSAGWLSCSVPTVGDHEIVAIDL